MPFRREDITPWQWSRAVRALRAALGLTRLALAGAVGVSEYTVSVWETRRGLPRHRAEERVRELARARGVPFVLEPEPFDLDVAGLDRPDRHEPPEAAPSW